MLLMKLYLTGEKGHFLDLFVNFLFIYLCVLTVTVNFLLLAEWPKVKQWLLESKKKNVGDPHFSEIIKQL